MTSTLAPDTTAPALRGNVILHGEDALLLIRIIETLNAKRQCTHSNADVLREAVRCLAKELLLTA